MRRSAALAAVVTMLAVVTAGCSDDDERSSARLSVDGVAEVSRSGETGREVRGTRALRVGDRVRVRQGTAEVRLTGDERLELREGSFVELAAGATGSPVRPELTAGPMLVSTGGRPLTVTSAGAEMAITGTARISRTLSLVVAVYSGSTDVTSAGRTLTVRAYRQVNVPAAGLLPARPSPVEYVPSDPWDRRLLSEAVDLGAQLSAKSQGFSSQPGAADRRTPASFRRLLPALTGEAAFDTLLDPARPAGETLVGAAIVLESRQGTFQDRWTSVFQFRGEGADWGFVAADHQVDRVAVLGAVDAAIKRAPTPVFAGGTVPPPTTRATRPTTAARGRTTPTTTRPPRTATPTTLPPAAPPPPDGALNTGLPIVDQTVDSVVDTLGGLLRGLGSG
ncbi:MAG: hypothetical protein M3O23_11760 [Actinomycetota bacterium]|nr:hypothetical protein [Actinomycetota bacterium]